MSNRPEPDDVDLFVGGVQADPQASSETSRIIEEYKLRADYPLELEEAERVLAALGISPRDYGMPDAKSLLEHWQGCVADLLKADHGATNGTSVANEDIPVGTKSPREEPA
jgi:hypothetical protein